MEDVKRELNSKIAGVLTHLTGEFVCIRSGGASVSLLDKVVVDVYGQRMPLNQVAGVTVPDPRQLLIQPWDKANVAAIEKAISESGLGLGVTNEGDRVRVSVPPLSDERRNELVKIAHKLAEEARVSIRSARRDAIDRMEQEAKSGNVGEDDQERFKKEYQQLIDNGIAEIDGLLERKATDLKSI
ncbi:ribosome recycling factor [Patescibacteria group bacterium]|nr:ribosome recycling factor [Patescibacteria group bacterium]